MSRWVISIPAWGGNYVNKMRQLVLPSMAIAVRHLGHPVHLICHTNCPDMVREAIPQGWTHEIRPVPERPTYVALQEGHADAVASAEPGDRVVLLNADLVVSGNILTACRDHFDAGQLAVVLLGIRTSCDDSVPPMGAEPRALLEWAWEHRHRIIRDLEWPAGRSMLPTNLFFTDAHGTVARGFHLHPVAIVKQETTSFRSTIDGDLLDAFPPARIHVVTNPDDCSMLEVSPSSRRFPVGGDGLSAYRVARAMITRASGTHRWLFLHQIGVVGHYRDDLDTRVAEDILQHMESSAALRAARGRTPAGKRI